MVFDAFGLRNKVVSDYRRYVESFIHILDPRLDDYVRTELARGRLWPDAVLQLNPNYEPGRTLGELADAGIIMPETARFFGRELRLHRHQQEALARAQAGRPYIVSTGTGSGKSLTYLLPIVDAIFRDPRPDVPSVRALVVYPMNALINSQLEALESFKKRNWPDCPIRFSRYTGQDRSAELRNQINNDPPHILLTNYVMLEYILIRPTERSLRERIMRDLSFLVMDELHVYRGRQGADVAMLMRRLRQQVERPGLLCVGTSATIASGANRAERRAAIAQVGSQLFGVEMSPGDVVDESLRAIVADPPNLDSRYLRQAIETPPPAPNVEAVAGHPLTPWIERGFGLADEEGRLIRRTPRQLHQGLAELTEASGMEPDVALTALRSVLEAGSNAELPDGNPVFAFRLHQFLASGASIYATAQPADRRRFDTEGQNQIELEDGRAQVYPLAFCRECGQDFYMCAREDSGDGTRLMPRPPQLNAGEDEMIGEPGYFSLQIDDMWSDEDEDIPDHWWNMRLRTPRLKDDYVQHRPQRFWLRIDGSTSHEPVEDGIKGWWQPRPLMLCPRCRASFDLRQEVEIRKLVTLSQTGRSTATTIVASSVIDGLNADDAIGEQARKLMSFTDNRQDAALQAGHTNDFVQVVLLRSALVRALDERGELRHDELGAAIFDAMRLPPEVWQKEMPYGGGINRRARQAMIQLLDYLAIEDLARAWRVAQPNLEQCGQLLIDYDGLDEIAEDHKRWEDVPFFSDASAGKRREVLKAILDHLRSALAIDADALDPDETDKLKSRVNADLKEPWALDRDERLERAALALLPDRRAPQEERKTIGLGWRSAVGRYLRSRYLWGIDRDLGIDAVDHLTAQVIERMRGDILNFYDSDGEIVGVRINIGAILWRRGDGLPPMPDPVRTRGLHHRRLDLRRQEPNSFFAGLYGDPSPGLSTLKAAEHTGQVISDHRQRREREFREGDLALLCCSPTMELGVDISDLSVVHLRNVPPTPANYAQRSGRAGRGGKPALVLAFASDGSAHDRYFFSRQSQMIAGAVSAPTLDLGNRELVRAHLQSLWLGMVGLRLGQSMTDVLDLDTCGFPLLPEHADSLDDISTRTDAVIARFREIAQACGPVLTSAYWFDDGWLEQTARAARHNFECAFDRWQDMYRAAIEQRDLARRDVDRPRQNRQEKRDAEAREREAKREIDLLLNQGTAEESDFYPYRYLASEGFIPGYNFPRLPLRTLVSGVEHAEAINRPRFLGLNEFGPHNIIYHEGRRHRIAGLVVPSSGIEARLKRAKLCETCGYLHENDRFLVDVCDGCGTAMEDGEFRVEAALLDQPTARAQRSLRITSEEEERAREGFVVNTYYRLATDTSRNIRTLGDAEGTALLRLECCPRADLWRVNHGWRRASSLRGFVIDGSNGRWVGDSQPADDAVAAQNRLPGIKPYVADIRNLLFVTVVDPTTASSDEFVKTLGYALRRGMQSAFQIEEQEINVELLGQGRYRRLLFWEAAEGGVGVIERLMASEDEVRTLADAALRHLHVGSDSDMSSPRACAAACYECLLSYANQIDHRYLDRRLVIPFLRNLTEAALIASDTGQQPGSTADLFRQLADPASSAEAAFINAIEARGWRMPDHAQWCPIDSVGAQVDFFYRAPAPGLCVFVDGRAHEQSEQVARDREQRHALEDAGFRVIVIIASENIDDQLNALEHLLR